MLKKVPIMPVCHGKNVYHWRWWVARSGDLLHASRVWQSSVQCWLPHSSCASSLLELSTVLLLVWGPLLLDSIRIYHAAAQICSWRLSLQSTIRALFP